MATIAATLPTETRAAINRANSAHSTGPVTEAGRAAVRFNAFKSGLHAKTLIIPGEDPAKFEALGLSLTATYKPQTDTQRDLVRILQESEWRIARVLVIETNLHMTGTLDYVDHVNEKYGPLDDDACLAMAQAVAYQANARLFEQINRQESRLRRLIDKTIKELRASLALHAPKTTKTENGFVLPKAEKYPDMPKFTGSFADRHRNEWIRKHGKKT